VDVWASQLNGCAYCLTCTRLRRARKEKASKGFVRLVQRSGT
jgi:AhpD family alkylhydroperoxidase